MQAAAEGARLALYKLDYKRKDLTSPEAKPGLLDIALLTTAGDAAAAQRGIDTAAILAEAIDAARTLILQPGNWLTPAKFAEEAVAQGEAVGLTVEVLDEKALFDRGFTGILAIARGSDQPPRLITMRWNGGAGAPIAIVGKGVTFDSGGIGIKPSAGMEKMKYDMAGGAATLATLIAAARLKLPLNIVGVIPAVENMPGERALVPNEIITMYGGLTAELVDTDCEGRVILADALAYAVKDLGAQAIVDMATLTGAVGVALGREVCGVMGNHQPLVDQLLAAGERAGELGWQLPMWEQFDDAIKSDLADIKNYSGRDAGTITAAAFLKAFVNEVPWVHLDIAGVAWTDADKGYRPKGPTGTPVRTVIELLRAWQSA
jgi:leucyl aminopeptidase